MKLEAETSNGVQVTRWGVGRRGWERGKARREKRRESMAREWDKGHEKRVIEHEAGYASSSVGRVVIEEKIA